MTPVRGTLAEVEILTASARDADGVIHNAFDMSTGDFAASNAVDAAAVDALIAGLQAQRALLIDVGLGTALPATLEIGGLLMEGLSENRAVEARSKRREELRAVVSAASREVGEGAWRLWTQEGAAAGLEEALAAATVSTEAVAAALREEVGAASALRARIVGHLAAL